MDFDIELELHRRPDTDSAVGLAATRLRTLLMSARNGITHDHRPAEGLRHTVQTLAPADAPPWASTTAELWNRVEWTERAGPAPVLFEARAPVPTALTDEEAVRFGAAVARFVADELRVPVSVTVLPGSGPWLMRGDEGRRQVRLCFPTRALAGPDSPDGVLNRSGIGSGFGGRLPMVMNHFLAKDFVRTLTSEVMRLGNLPTPPPVPSPPAASPLAALPAAARVGGRARDGEDTPAEQAIDLDRRRSLSRVGKRMHRSAAPTVPVLPASPVDPARYPLVTRLRKEAPRGMDILELRDFEQSMDLSIEVEDALRDITDLESGRLNLESSEARLQAHMLEHRYLLDEARRRRSKTSDELQQLKTQKGFVLFVRGRLQAAVLARAEKTKEFERSKEHVRELKVAVHRLQRQIVRTKEEWEAREDQLIESRARLRFSIRALASNDPRVLTHLTGIVDDAQRAHLKACMDAPAKPAASPGKAGNDESEGKSGPPSHPAPPGSRPRARVD
ncbi:MobA/MobL family protein [Luteibacter sp. CQ10]|uniref:MobA/MobL family protein n=1 Tax=Luteibacter sp. CQ10 TaxID=2805821 RepID=UPI0034A20BBE